MSGCDVRREARPFDVVVVGEVNPDLILRGEVTPVFGQVEQMIDDAQLVIGSSSAIFACGAAGGIARRGSEVATAAGISVNVIDTTGAGDSFDAGFVYGYLHGWSLERTVRLACACGSLSTRAAGGTAAQATLAEAMAGA
ncbi:MAG: hypothetical protein NVS4B8_28490 [Herpetosiphon sp.]